MYKLGGAFFTMDNLTYEHMLLDSSNDFYYFCNLDDFNIQYINAPLCNYLGLNLQESINKKCYEIIHNRTSPCLFCVNEELLYDTVKIKSIETTYKLNDKKFKCSVAILDKNDNFNTHMTRFIVDEYDDLNSITHTNKKSLISDKINPSLVDILTAIDNDEFLFFYNLSLI